MHQADLGNVLTNIRTMRPTRAVGRVSSIRSDGLTIGGLCGHARLGDQVCIEPVGLPPVMGEIIAMAGEEITVLPRDSVAGVALGDKTTLEAPLRLYPDESWIGRVVDPLGQPLDGRPLNRGPHALPLDRAAPPAVTRRALGPRLETGLVVFNTMLPLAQGQRLGVFAGSGVGKTTLLGQLAQNVEADVVVIAMVGERGREIRHFVDSVLGKEGMRRSVIVAATSDQSPLLRRQCAFAAMTIAEYFRDKGQSVLYVADSISRLAEAHREVAVAAGEPPALRGHPASMCSLITSLCERAGPASGDAGDITAVFSVLVAGSDMDEPIADTMRGVLDGHIVLDRDIAEAGRYPAVDIVRSVSRSLPAAATEAENVLIARVRRLVATYERSKTLVRSGLYTEGTDPDLDQSIRLHDDLDAFFSRIEPNGIENSFRSLKTILRAGNFQVTAQQTRP